MSEFKTILEDLTWMDDESKEKASEKADYIRPQIGYPDLYDDEEYLNSNYDVSHIKLIF